MEMDFNLQCDVMEQDVNDVITRNSKKQKNTENLKIKPVTDLAVTVESAAVEPALMSAEFDGRPCFLYVDSGAGNSYLLTLGCCTKFVVDEGDNERRRIQIADGEIILTDGAIQGVLRIGTDAQSIRVQKLSVRRLPIDAGGCDFVLLIGRDLMCHLGIAVVPTGKPPRYEVHIRRSIGPGGDFDVAEPAGSSTLSCESETRSLLPTTTPEAGIVTITNRCPPIPPDSGLGVVPDDLYSTTPETVLTKIGENASSETIVNSPNEGMSFQDEQPNEFAANPPEAGMGSQDELTITNPPEFDGMGFYDRDYYANTTNPPEFDGMGFYGDVQCCYSISNVLSMEGSSEARVYPILSNHRSHPGAGGDEASPQFRDVGRPDRIKPTDSTSESWKHFYSGYWIRERLLREDEVRDTPKQTRTFEIRWDSEVLCSAFNKRAFDFGIALVNKLSPTEKIAFMKEIDTYIARKWWIRPFQRVTPDDHGVIVFPVVQGSHKSTKVRPVLDCRRYNETVPKATYKGSDCGKILRQLRVAITQFSGQETCELITLDLKSAFYRIRLHDKLIHIRCNGDNFDSDRVTFGVRYGPMTLEMAVRALLWKALDDSGRPRMEIFYYLDDITLVGTELTQFVEKLRELAASFGFEFPLEKQRRIILRRTNAVLVPDHFDAFVHLGVKFCKEGDDLGIACVQKPLHVLDDTVITRRVGFMYAGMGLDMLLMHGERCVASDLLRRIVNSPDWDTKLDVNRSDWDALVEKLSPIPCFHKVMTNPVRSVKIWTDASMYGYGFLIQLDGVTFMRRGRIWGVKHRRWHINRREFHASIEALLALNDIAHYLQGAELDVYTDSKSARAWLDKVKSKSIERACLERLSNLRSELIDQWVTSGYITHVRFESIAGVLNTEADILSRLGEKWKISRKLLLCEDEEDPPTDPVLIATSLNKASEQARTGPVLELVRNSSLVRAWAAWRSVKSGPTAPEPEPNAVLRSMQASSVALTTQRKFLESRERSGFSHSVLQKQTEFRFVRDGIVWELKFQGGDLSQPPTAVVVCDVGTPIGENLVRSTARSIHESYGHCSVRYVCWRLSKILVCQGLKKLVVDAISDCSTCRTRIRADIRRQAYVLQNRLDTTAECFFDVVSIDLFVVPRERCCESVSYVLVLIDHFSRYVIIAGLASKSANEIEMTLDQIFTLFLKPNQIRSDNAKEFKALSKKKKYSWYRIPAYAPFANGICERVMSSIRKSLASQNWVAQLPGIMRRLNHKRIPELDMSPAQIVFGRDANDLPLVSKTTDDVLNLLNGEDAKRYIAERERMRHEVLRIRAKRDPTRPPPVDTALPIGTGMVRVYDGKIVVVRDQNGPHVVCETSHGKTTTEHIRNLRIILPAEIAARRPGGACVVTDSDNSDSDI